MLPLRHLPARPTCNCCPIRRPQPRDFGAHVPFDEFAGRRISTVEINRRDERLEDVGQQGDGDGGCVVIPLPRMRNSCIPRAWLILRMFAG